MALLTTCALHRLSVKEKETLLPEGVFPVFMWGPPFPQSGLLHGVDPVTCRTLRDLAMSELQGAMTASFHPQAACPENLELPEPSFPLRSSRSTLVKEGAFPRISAWLMCDVRDLAAEAGPKPLGSASSSGGLLVSGTVIQMSLPVDSHV